MQPVLALQQELEQATGLWQSRSACSSLQAAAEHVDIRYSTYSSSRAAYELLVMGADRFRFGAVNKYYDRLHTADMNVLIECKQKPHIVCASVPSPARPM